MGFGCAPFLYEVKIMEFLDKNGLRTLWAQINNLVNSKIGSGGGLYRHYVTGWYTTPKPDKMTYQFEFTINNSSSTALTVSDFTSTTMVNGYSYIDGNTEKVNSVIMSVSPTSTTGSLGIKVYSTTTGNVNTYTPVSITNWVDTVTEI